MPNDFYTPTGNPPENTAIVSTDMRAEFAAINAGFNKLPGLTGNANKLVVINSSGTGMDVTVAPAGLTSINKIALTQPANGATFTLLDGKTLTVNNTLTLAGTDSTVMTFPATSASVARIDAAQTFEGVQDFNGRIDANAGLAVTGANFTSRGITDNATAKALTLSGSGANSVTIANSATNPTIGTSAGAISFNPVAQGEVLRVTTGGASTVNYWSLSGALTGSRLTLLATGSDTNVGASWQTKGTGTHLFVTETGASAQVEITHTASADRYITLTGSNGGNPTIGTSGGYLNHSATVLFSGPTAPLATTTGTYANSTAVGFVDSTRTADNRQFDLTFSAGTIKFRALNDAYTQAANAIAILGGYGAGITGINLYTSAAGAAGTIQVAVTHTAAANRYITLTGSNGGNPTIGTSAGDLNIASATGYLRNTAATTSIVYSVGTAGSGTFVASGAAGQTTAFQMLIAGAETGRMGSSGDGINFATGAAVAIQVAVAHTAAANRYIILTGSNGGNPTIGTSGGSLALSSVINYIGTGSTDYAALYGGTGAFTVQAAGGSANIALQLIAKGTGAITFGNLTETQVAVTNTASANRYLTLTGSNGSNPTIGTSGGDLKLTANTNTINVLGALVSTLQVYANNQTATPAGGAVNTGVFLGSAGIGIFFGSGAPTVSAVKGSIYLRSNGSTTNDRMYINTDGNTTWTAVTTAA